MYVCMCVCGLEPYVIETAPSLRLTMVSTKKNASEPASCANEYNLVIPPTVPDAMVRIDALDKSLWGGAFVDV